ncbi:MAG: thioredoxin reductase [Nitrospirae bacterium CG_4_10_14_3_um_filter_44_29]|nr:FAD-dependent oxidoreductase [Nitrospirota bacterium]OIO28635.1 MAG: thioredoxin reductase [Nitrospirae bacterium CG1_02_44_142]PIV65579.1 MAG: thioredoxin reductase [Nitrospirae bacterium CG01_land_8_20_14_3_00_44_22]PIX87175.1 MAG: thioredoxin reductase [Nitrospirae bacterium CG_4_10_14_3_um_filter_44_29]PJA82029.1 MAG: thioredoxin reductase [Nitrospirae bacterium CG_4_9_14_3_um_filter_44_28]
MTDLYDVIIIGGGPAGLSAAQYAARAKLKTIVLDKSKTAGALAFSRKIENYPGLPEPLTGKELLDIFRKQAVKFGAEYAEVQVVGVNLTGNVKEVFTMDKNYSGKTVIIATGSMGRKPTIKGEAEFLGKGVSYCAICDAAFYKGKTVCVIGDSEEAVKEAGLLTKFAETVYLISPSSKLKVEDDYPALSQPNLKILPGQSVTAIEGNEVVERIKMSDADKKETALEVSGVFVYLHGSKPIIDFLGGNIDLSEEECIVTNRMMETSILGVFAAGDMTCTEVRQIVVSAANGCIAALSAERYITHRSRRRYDWGK